MDVIRVSNLRVQFGDVVAVDDVSFSVKRGEFVTLLGPSGCGKTTTLRVIAGLEKPTSGTVHIGGKLVSGEGRFVPPEARDLGMVFQSYAIWPHMTVAENVAFGLKMRGVPKSEISDRVDAALRMVKMQEFKNRLATDLSGGQQQRVALARALVYEPSVILYDEPLSNLDAQLREAMRTELAELHARTEITGIYVTHDQVEAMALSTRILVMERGRIVQSGPPEKIYDEPASRVVAEFIGAGTLLPARVVERVADTTALQLEDSARVILHVNKVIERDRASVCLRPERIRIEPVQAGADHTGGTNRLLGRIVTKQFCGYYTDISVDVGGTRLRTYLFQRTPLDVGDECVLFIRPEDVIVLSDP